MSDKNFTDSTNNTMKEPEYQNKLLIDEYYKSINIQKSESTPEKIDFKFSSKEKKWNFKKQITYHFKHDIERVWFILKNYEMFSFMSNEGHYPCVYIKGKDTWKVGNIFKGNSFKFCPFVAKVTKCVNLPETKEIKWLFHLIQEKCIFSLKYHFYKICEDNSSVVLLDMKSEKELTNLRDKINEMFSIKRFKFIDDLLENETISLLKYESGIIQGKMEDIYDVISDSNKCSLIAPNNSIIPNCSLKDLKIGEKKKVSIIKNGNINTFDIILRSKEINPGWNKWNIAVEVSGGEPKKVPNHCILFQLTKINNEECQLILLTKFHEPINSHDFNEYTMEKKYIIMSIKDYFENFYAQESSN